MAKVTTTPREVDFVLTLSAAEAQYVRSALSKCEPKYLDLDDVWTELAQAMANAGVMNLDDAATYIG